MAPVPKSSIAYSTNDLVEVRCPLHENAEYNPLFMCEPNNWKQNRTLLVVQCSECDLVFFSPNLSPEIRKAYHDQYYFRANENGIVGYPDYLDDSHMAAKIYFGRLILTWFEKSWKDKRKKPNSILDLGCATGHMLVPFQNRGWKTVGIDFSEFAVSWGIENLNLDLRCQDIDELMLSSKEKFDCVLSWDSFEHLQDPRRLLRMVYKHSVKSMRWIFQLPNVDFYLDNCSHPFWSLYQHSFHYSPDTFRMICEAEDFEIANTLPSSQKGEMLFIVKKKGD